MSRGAMTGGRGDGGAFVLGSARCGSTLVSDMLRLHPDLLSLSEVFSVAGANAFRPGRPDGARFWRAMARPSRALARVGNPEAAPREFLYGRVADPAHDPFLCPPLLSIALPHLTPDPDALFDDLGRAARARPRMPLADHYRALFDDLAGRFGRRCWVERSGGSLVAAATLRRMFPGARFVLLLRDGCETALSMRDYPATRLAIWMWRQARRVGVDMLHPRRHYGRGGLWPLLQKLGGIAPMGAVLSRPPDLRDCGAFWSAITLAGLRGLRGLPAGRMMTLRYAALVAEPAPELRRLGLFLAGAAPDAWVAGAAALPAARPSRAERLPPADRRTLQDACAPGEEALARHAAPLAP